MKIETLIRQNLAIVYDRDQVADPSRKLFTDKHWLEANRVLDSAPGRGAALFLETPFGPAVLRHYRRGGWAARFSEDRYFYTGYRRSRPFREFSLLARLFEHDLPVPQPLAAQCTRQGIWYRGALLTRTIPDVSPLADCLSAGVGDDAWARIGACVACFHAAGAFHADLNARNVLLQDEGESVYLVDFDRGKFNPGRPVDGRGNLERLRRSLEKLWPETPSRQLSDCWTRLMEGYRG